MDLDSLVPEKLKIDPYGVLVGHTWAEVGIVLEIINQFEIKCFVEIGVHRGGLAMLMTHATEHIPNFRYLGLEIDRDLVVPTVKKLFNPVVTGRGERDLWIRDAHDPTAVESVQNWISNPPGPALIYCDGGDKPHEFRLYAPILRIGDYIAAHDFDYGGYERAEIRMDDIRGATLEHGLDRIPLPRPYRIALFKKVK